MSARIKRPTEPYPPIQRFEAPDPKVQLTAGHLLRALQKIPESTLVFLMNEGPEVDRYTMKELDKIVIDMHGVAFVALYPGETVR